MSRQYLIPGAGYINSDEAARQYLIPGFGYVSEQGAAAPVVLANPPAWINTITANSSSQNSVLPSGIGITVELVNAGPDIAFVDFTNDSIASVDIPTLTAGGFPVFANQPALAVDIKSNYSRIVYISAGNSTVYINRSDD